MVSSMATTLADGRGWRDRVAYHTFRVGREEPKQEDDLDFVVERHPPGNEHVGHGLSAEKKSEHDPIHHPFDVIPHALRLHRCDGRNSRGSYRPRNQPSRVNACFAALPL